MHFELSILIKRQPEDCFLFLQKKDSFPQKPGSPVLVLEKTTPGPVKPGTRYREVVRMFPLVRGEIRSEINRFEPPRWLDETFESSWMRGCLSYEFVPEENGTRLVQREELYLVGILNIIGIRRVCEAIIKRTLEPRLQSRLEGIKNELEGGWDPH